MMRILLAIAIGMGWCLGLVATAVAEEPLGSSGWRCNYTGLWPEAKVPTEWSYEAQGVRRGLRCASKSLEKPEEAELVDDGFLRHWLVLGPFEVGDSVKEFEA